MKKFWIILCVIAVLWLWGCDAANKDQAAGSVPQTTAGTEPVIPTDPAKPDVPVVYAETVQITDRVPKYDTNSDRTIYLEGEVEDAFEAEYLHVPYTGSHTYQPYDGEVLWVSQEQQETKSGSHYDVYALEDGALRKLENKTFSRSYTLSGVTVALEFTYAEHEGKVYLTYEPVRRDETVWASVVSTERGAEKCLVAFFLGDKGKCYGTVDLRTGALTELHPGVSPDQIPNCWVVDWRADGSLVLQMESDGRLAFLDVKNGSITVYDPAALLPGENLYKSIPYPNGIACYAFTDAAEGRCDMWWVDLDGNVTKVLQDKKVKQRPTEVNPCVVYYGPDGEYILQVMGVEGEVTLTGVPTQVEYFGRACAYVDGDGVHHIADPVKGSDVALRLPEGWTVQANGWHPRPDGAQLLTGKTDENGTVQLLIYDLQTRTLTHLRRENPNGTEEGYYAWAGEDILIHTESRNDFFLYDMED